jgi:hypothetical protein
MKKVKRNLSGMYFRSQKEDGTWENRCFEDLSREEQEEKLNGKSEEWLRSAILILADTLNEVGEKTQIARE